MKSVATHPLAVTLGVGLKNAQAKRHPIYPRGPVSSLVYVLQDEVDADAESWWSPHLFKGDYRKKENWEYSIAFAVDLDYYAPGRGHSSPHPDVREALAKLTFTANFMHDTPRGARVVGLASAPISDPELYHHAALAFASSIERSLQDADVLGRIRREKGTDGKSVLIVERAGYVVDHGALVDRARLYFCPSAQIEGEASPRSHDIIVIDPKKLFDAEELTASSQPNNTLLATANASSPTNGASSTGDGPMARVLATLAKTSKAKHRVGQGVSIRCPIHGKDDEPSAIVFERTGAFHCSVCTPHMPLRDWVKADAGAVLLGEDLVEEILSAGRSAAASRVPRVESKRLAPTWPAPLDAAAFHGIAGEFVQIVEPQTEADPAALLFQFLVAVGNIVGRKVHVRVESTRHYLVLFLLVVGDTSKARKGTAWGRVLEMLPPSTESWKQHRVASGLSSGEGLISMMRDEARDSAEDDDEEDEEDAGGEHASEDGDDRRLMIVEPEFGRVLNVMERQSNTLSATLRHAWDSGNLRVITRKDPIMASNVHISVTGHITLAEFRHCLRTTDALNGFANRFLLACVKRARMLPFGGNLDSAALASVTQRLEDVLTFAENLDEAHAEVKFGPAARELWASVYPELSEGRPGTAGAVTARAEAQALRLAALYALLDKSLLIEVAHLRAALAAVAYVDASARCIFGEETGDDLADDIVAALRQRPDGMTRTELRDFFERNKSRDDIERALGILRQQGMAVVTSTKTGGRPAERWTATQEAPTSTTVTTKALAVETPSVVSVVSSSAGEVAAPSTEAGVPDSKSGDVRRIAYGDLSPFQRNLFDEHGEVFDVVVTGAPSRG